MTAATALAAVGVLWASSSLACVLTVWRLARKADPAPAWGDDWVCDLIDHAPLADWPSWEQTRDDINDDDALARLAGGEWA